MNDDEVMRHIRENTPLNQVRSVLSGVIGAAEQAGMQRRPQSPVEMRAAEFAGLQRILDAAVRHGLVRLPTTRPSVIHFSTSQGL